MLVSWAHPSPSASRSQKHPNPPHHEPPAKTGGFARSITSNVGLGCPPNRYAITYGCRTLHYYAACWIQVSKSPPQQPVFPK